MIKTDTYEVVTTRYEHRVIKTHNAGEYYGKDVIFNVGEILKKTRTPGKYKYYGTTLGHGVGVDIPVTKVGVFKITKVARVTETEEQVD